MKYEVDSYILEYFESENKYFISFKDSVGTNCRLEISKEIFDEYMFSKKCYVKIKNEKIRHIVYENYSDEELYEKQFNVEESVEEKVIKKITQEQIRQALKELTETQYRRINLHIVNKFTIEDLAKIEKVRTNQIEKSLKIGLKKIKNFFEK